MLTVRMFVAMVDGDDGGTHSLFANNIGSEGGKVILEALKANSTLKKIWCVSGLGGL